VFRSRRNKQFKALFAKLPADVQHLATKNYELWKRNPSHPGLDFKCIDPREPPTYSVRVGDHYRAAGALRGDTIIWFWIGSHETYNKLF
jgi:hypothetical protein